MKTNPIAGQSSTPNAAATTAAAEAPRTELLDSHAASSSDASWLEPAPVNAWVGTVPVNTWVASVPATAPVAQSGVPAAAAAAPAAPVHFDVEALQSQRVLAGVAALPFVDNYEAVVSRAVPYATDILGTLGGLVLGGVGTASAGEAAYRAQF